MTADSPIRLDGIPDEAVWMRAESITAFVQYDPEEGQPATERTVVRFLRDGAALYVGVWAYDRAPAQLRRTQLLRDSPVYDDDEIALLLDPAFDRRTGLMLAINPNGALWDAEIGGQWKVNPFWNGVWDGRATVRDEGWVAELRIPFQMLRLAAGTDRMGLNVARYIRRKNEWVLWRSWRRQHGIFFQEAEGVLEGLAPVPPRGRLELRPFLTATHEAGAGERPAGADGLRGSVGLDAKVAVSPTATLDLTANTDFAQADADALVLNLTRFPIFFPERREFFLESAPLFDFGTPGNLTLFHSRRVGLDSVGATVPIVAGARLTGRAGAQRIGFLVVRTGDPEAALDVVARVHRDVGARGSVGAIATVQRKDGASTPPLAAGLDVRLPLVVRGRNVEPSGYLAAASGGEGAPTGVAWRVALDYPQDGAAHFIALQRVSKGFTPSLGFAHQTGIWDLQAQFRFYPRPRRWGIRRLLLSALEAEVGITEDWRVDNAVLSVRPIGAEFESSDWVELYVRRYQDAPVEDFELFPGVTIPGRAYTWHRVELGFASDNSRVVSLGMTASVGGFYGGTSTNLSYEPALRLSPHLIAGIAGSVRWVRLPEGRFTAQLQGIRLDYATSPRLGVTARVQWENEGRQLAVNARLHWIPRPGRDVYLVYATYWPTPPGAGIPWAEPLGRSVVAKVVWYIRPEG